VPKSLLLADDSVTIQKAVEMTFKAEDVTVTVASNGNEAWAYVKESKPDLLLADVEMPGLDGYQLCEKIRADAATRHIPVLLLGGGTPVDPAKAIAVGANGHMPKPFDSQKLIDQVKQILANPKVGAAAARSAPPPASRPAAPASRPPGPVAARPAPGGATATGSTLTMARPPSSPGMRPAAAAARPPTAPPGAPRPSGAPPRPAVAGATPAGSRPPPLNAAARPPTGSASRPPTGSVPRPGAPSGNRPTALRPPVPGQAKPASPQGKPSAPPQRRPAAPGADDDVPMEVDDIVEDAAPGASAQLRAVPPAPSNRQPALSVVPDGKGAPSDGGEAMLREALSKASREVIEKIAWEVVPELAETIIREELERLMKERGT
jgi:CheY-like chemotaxis protein